MARKVTRPTAVMPALALVPVGYYLRRSTEEQAQGYGLDAQRVKCDAMLTLKSDNGWTFAGEYVDDGVSGTKDESKRPGLARLLADIKAGRIKAVIVPALDRLARSVTLTLRLVAEIAGAGCALVSCKESLDTATPAGRLMLTIFAAMAEWERDTITERMTAGRNERGKVDGERGGRVPMGYQRVGDGVVQVEKQSAATVRRIFELRDQYDMTTRQIAERLNAEGVQTPRGATRWHASAVSIVLRNRAAYQGGQRADSPARWPRILAADRGQPPPEGQFSS